MDVVKIDVMVNDVKKDDVVNLFINLEEFIIIELFMVIIFLFYFLIHLLEGMVIIF